MQKTGMKGLLFVTLLLTFLSFESSTPERGYATAAVGTDYPRDYFQSPVGHMIRLTGSFGELRAGHFHAGLDIDGTTGVPVYAAADGYIAIIKVQASAYGNVLYIKHPNGYTTLYAHLDRFAPEIQQYVKEQQYKRTRFEVNLHPPAEMFRVSKGQEIGKMGNTGGSRGPHLHFEVRNTATQKVVNPQLFGMPVQDDVAPDIRDMKVYFLNEKREVLDSKPFPVGKQKTGGYDLEGDTVRIGAWRVGFGVKAYDTTTGNKNDNGIYALSMFVEDQLAFEWRMDEMDFDESRYINAHIDYSAQKRYGAWFHRCFVLPGDKLSNYVKTETMGAVPLFAEKPQKITIKVQDALGNARSIHFWALRDTQNMVTYPSTADRYKLPYDTERKLMLGDLNLTIPKGALYETLTFEYFVSAGNAKNQFSPMHHLQDSKTPVHKYYEISIKPYGLPEWLHNKAVIAKCGDGKPDNCGASWRGDYIMTKVREFGQYCVMIDTTPPQVTPVVFNKDMRRNSTMAFKITDNMAVNGLAYGLYFRGTIDGKWVLFQYDKKRSRITHVFESWLEKGTHTLQLEVKDDRDNVVLYTQKFLR
ncbi:MAG: M23 family metallopeptidase [Saprospiraceae bacterium]|jgi:hypothetical protein